MRHSFAFAWCLAFFACLFAFQLPAATKTWTNGAGTGLWNNAGNWSPAGVPGTNDEVVFNATSTADCALDTDPVIKTLDIQAAYAGVFSLGPRTLTLEGINNASALLTVAGAGSLAANSGKVVFAGPGKVNCTATLYNLTIQTASTSHDIVLLRDLNVGHQLLIEEVNTIDGAFSIHVAGGIVSNDAAIAGGLNTAVVDASANSTLSGTGTLPRLNVPAGVILTLLNDFKLQVSNASAKFFFSGGGDLSGGKNLVFGSAGQVNFSGSVDNVLMNTAGANDDITLVQNLKVNNKLTITKVGELSGAFDYLVGQQIEITDSDLQGASDISAAGAATTYSGGGNIHRLRVESGANLQLLTPLTLFNASGSTQFFLAGSGNITGMNLIFGEQGTVNFSGTVENVTVQTDNPNNEDIVFNANSTFNITKDLNIVGVNDFLGGKQIRVGGNLTAATDTPGGNCTIVMTGSGTSTFSATGGGTFLPVIIDKTTTADRVTLLSSNTFSSLTVNKGVFDLNDEFPTVNIVVNSGGTLGGVGIVVGNVTINPGGVGSPGNSPGGWSILGNLTISGTIEMEIIGRGDVVDGTGVEETDFDQINVGGNVVINGTINVVFGSYFPTVGDIYTLFDVSGTFSGTTGTSVTSVHTIAVSFTQASGTLEILSAILPIELVYFRAFPQKEAVELQWGVGAEKDNDYMAVERSADGARFEEIGRVSGRGTANTFGEYSWIDVRPLPGVSYYRLRQVDFDGSVAYHKVVSVQFAAAAEALSLLVFPNPAVESIHLNWTPLSGETMLIRLFDPASGRLLRQYRPDGKSGQYEIPLSDLPAGTYVLQVGLGDKMESRVVVKR